VFSFSNAIEDAAAAVAYLRTPEIIKGAHLAPDRIAVVGHSMGGFMAAFTGARDPAIIGVGLISAWNIGPDTIAFAKEAGRPAALKDMADSVPPLTGCTAESLLEEVLAHASEWNFVDQAAALASRPLLFVNSDDGGAPHSEALAAAARKAGAKSVTEVHFPTDHGYNDHRIALQTAVLNWLETLAAKKP
jgi:acetyl esterase/lipase